MAIERAYIHITGPAGAGKTTLIERLLPSAHALIMVARCRSDDRLRKPRESVESKHPELLRYLAAGASNVVEYRWPVRDVGWDHFWETDFIQDYSEAIVLEGDCPVDYVDVRVFVAPPSPDGALLRRVQQDNARIEAEKRDHLERMLADPSMAPNSSTEEMVTKILGLAQAFPEFFDEARREFQSVIDASRCAPPLAPTERWALAEGYEGIQRAQVVAINIRSNEERRRGETMLPELARLRSDRQVFEDIMGWRGKRIPITAVAADLSDEKDGGTRKIVARIKRAIAACRRTYD